MPPFNKERGKPLEPDRAMWRFALLTCREADATFRVRNLTVIGAVVAGAFALREGLSCLYLSLLPAGVSILVGTATVGLVRVPSGCSPSSWPHC